LIPEGLPPPPFEPYFRHGHLATIAGNFWKRNLDLVRFPAAERVFQTEAEVRVMAKHHRPDSTAASARVVILHGLEGSHESGYCQSLAQACLLRGWEVYRLNMRGCGGTEALSKTLYHAGLTSDLRSILSILAPPVFLAGFSLGGNVVLKLAGELGCNLIGKVAGVAAVSTPLDLAECCRSLRHWSNRVYESRFVDGLKARYRRRHAQHPSHYSLDGLDAIRTVIDFDDRITAPYFGFGNAARYYATQSAQEFLGGIAVPGLLIHAQDDPMIPFAVYERARVEANPKLRLITPAHGGHVGFISRRTPRFWVDEVIPPFFDTLV
jgi:predicted alpha/beta-fold hydrolase